MLLSESLAAVILKYDIYNTEHGPDLQAIEINLARSSGTNLETTITILNCAPSSGLQKSSLPINMTIMQSGVDLFTILHHCFSLVYLRKNPWTFL